ncbi:hypothetical protein N185_08625 [Sinorhizobium sp. GW3]|nr:hypothetical protein N185_08625 [Sinorhizobium sp. GW3]
MFVALTNDLTHRIGAVMYTACKARYRTAGLDEVRERRGKASCTKACRRQI